MLSFRLVILSSASESHRLGCPRGGDTKGRVCPGAAMKRIPLPERGKPRFRTITPSDPVVIVALVSLSRSRRASPGTCFTPAPFRPARAIRSPSRRSFPKSSNSRQALCRKHVPSFLDYLSPSFPEQRSAISSNIPRTSWTLDTCRPYLGSKTTAVARQTRAHRKHALPRVGCIVCKFYPAPAPSGRPLRRHPFAALPSVCSRIRSCVLHSQV